MAAQMTPRFRDLPDVNWSTFVDGEVPTYDSGTDTITGEAAGSAGAVTQEELEAHADDTSFVHGIVNTQDIATDTELAAHIADTTAIHGLANTANVILVGDSRLTDSRPPNGPAGGALAGSYPNPTLAGGGAVLDDAVILAPVTDVRNTIVGDNVVGLTVQRATNNGPAQAWQDVNGVEQASIAVSNTGGGQLGLVKPDTALLSLSTVEGLNLGVPDATPTTEVLQTYVYSNPDWSFQIRVDGKMRWGNGTDPVDTVVERVAANVLAAPSLEFSEVTAPATPAANKGRLFFRDSSGTTQACVKFPSGNVVVIAEDF